MIRCAPVLLDGPAVFYARFVVQYLYIKFMATLFDAPADDVVCDDMVEVMFVVEGFYKDNGAVSVVS